MSPSHRTIELPTDLSRVSYYPEKGAFSTGTVKLREDSLTALQDTPSNSPFIVSAAVAEGTEDDNIVSQYLRNSVQNVN